jgi:hypothetical protein
MADLPWEDSLLERKLQSDLKDLLKTLVAFANSVRPGHVATILIGERDDGTVQGVNNADNIQKAVRATCNRIYPPILWRAEVYEKDGKTCIRVEIEYDGETPHFGGAAWVRRGSVTESASDEVFQRLIEFRLSKVRELAKWINQEVTVTPDIGVPHEVRFDAAHTMQMHPRLLSSVKAMLRSVNSFWVTFETHNHRQSEPLEKVTLSCDDEHDNLQLLIKV